METQHTSQGQGRIQEFTIVDVAYRGAGIAKDDGIVTFIPGTLPGEKVLAKVVSNKKRFQNATLIKVLTPSANRIEPCCRTEEGILVPGCVYDHVDYKAEVELKNSQLKNFLRNLATPEVFLPPFASPAPLGYRNKIVLHVQRKGAQCKIGYLGEDNKTVVDIQRCPLANPSINYAWSRMRQHAAYSLPDGASITFRHTEKDGVLSWEGKAPSDIGCLTEHSPVGDLQIPTDGFYQVNPQVACALVEQVRQWLKEIVSETPCDTLLDLYCGVGVFALAAAADGFKNIIGVESGRNAIAAAKRNAKNLGLNGVTFICDTVAGFAKNGLDDIPLNNAVVIADPPRQGMEPETVQALASSQLQKLIYVSCDPATLTRDLAKLTEKGFKIKKAKVFDMFPRTAHFESLIYLSR